MEMQKINLLVACFVGGMTLAILQPAVASETGDDVSKQINALRVAVNSAEVFLIARDSESRYDFGEADIARLGCRYVVSDQADIDSLVDVLVNAKLVAIRAIEGGYDGRILIRLNEGNEKRHIFVLSPDYSNANAQGEYRLVSSNFNRTIPVEATNKIERDLRFWASQHRSLAPKACGR